MDYDFISIGGGLGGLAGAIAAHDAGLSVAIVEKSEKLGGVAALSAGQLWVAGSHLEAECGIADSPEDGLAYLTWLGGGYGRESLARTLCETAPEALRYFEERAGVRWMLLRDYPDYHYPMGERSLPEGRYVEVEPFLGADLGDWQANTRSSLPPAVTNAEQYGKASPVPLAERRARDERGMGGGLGAYFTKAALDRGIPVFIGVTVEKLHRENGRVTGLSGTRAGEPFALQARRGILIATSGYDWDSEFVGRHDVRPGSGTRVPPAVTGDHLRWAGMLGAQVASITVRPQWIGIAFREQADIDAEGMPRWQNIAFRNPHCILVNRRGRRFCDESWGPSYVPALSHADIDAPAVANQPFWVVFDSRHRARYRVGLAMPGEPLSPAIVSAPTIRELAEKCGIDADGLEAQIARFNPAAEAGEDAEFGRGTRPQARANGDRSHQPNPNLGPVSDPPFYAVRMEASSIGIPTAGLVGDSAARVLDWWGAPIDGLYVAGNSMAMLDLGIGYNSGLANTRGITFAYIAARHAAGTGTASSPKTIAQVEI
ncbi:MAG TPA: FAD-binding protein [Allosphingosinicella sp.]